MPPGRPQRAQRRIATRRLDTEAVSPETSSPCSTPSTSSSTSSSLHQAPTSATEYVHRSSLPSTPVTVAPSPSPTCRVHLSVPPPWPGVVPMPSTPPSLYGSAPLHGGEGNPLMQTWAALMMQQTAWPEACEKDVQFAVARAAAEQIAPYLQDYGEFRRHVSDHLRRYSAWSHLELAASFDRTVESLDCQGDCLSVCTRELRELQLEFRDLRTCLADSQHLLHECRRPQEPHGSATPHLRAHCSVGDPPLPAREPRDRPRSSSEISEMIAAAQCEALRSRSPSPHPLVTYDARGPSDTKIYQRFAG